MVNAEEWRGLAFTAIVKLFAAEGAAAQPEMEAKVSDKVLPGMSQKVNPHWSSRWGWSSSSTSGWGLTPSARSQFQSRSAHACSFPRTCSNSVVWVQCVRAFLLVIAPLPRYQDQVPFLQITRRTP